MIDRQLEQAMARRRAAILKASTPSVRQVRITQGDGTYQEALQITLRGQQMPLIPLQGGKAVLKRN